MMVPSDSRRFARQFMMRWLLVLPTAVGCHACVSVRLSGLPVWLCVSFERLAVRLSPASQVEGGGSE